MEHKIYCIAFSILHNYHSGDDVSNIYQSSSSLLSFYLFEIFTYYIAKMKAHTTKQPEKVKRENKLIQQDKHLLPCPEKTLHC